MKEVFPEITVGNRDWRLSRVAWLLFAIFILNILTSLGKANFSTAIFGACVLICGVVVGLLSLTSRFIRLDSYGFKYQRGFVRGKQLWSNVGPFSVNDKGKIITRIKVNGKILTLPRMSEDSGLIAKHMNFYKKGSEKIDAPAQDLNF